MSAPDAATVDLYFDFASPYAWFAHRPLMALAQRHDLQLRRRPVLLWAILKELNMPPPMDHAAKAAYLRHDMYRSARHYGLRFQLPAKFPFSSHGAARLYYALEARAPEQAGELAEALLAACFERQLDTSSPEVLVQLATPFGFSAAEARAALEDPAHKESLRQANGEGAARGVWGSPYWFWNGEAFFGADRVAQFERMLADATAPL
jgi:2-hydroxychromene-2-carboxylate isomerase